MRFTGTLLLFTTTPESQVAFFTHFAYEETEVLSY